MRPILLALVLFVQVMGGGSTRAADAMPYSEFLNRVEEVLAAPTIAWPLTLPMCAPLSDGAAAVIVCSKAGLRRLGIDRRRAVKVAASVDFAAQKNGFTVTTKQTFAATKGAEDLTLCVRLRVSSDHSKLSLASKFGAGPGESKELLMATRQVADALGICFHVGSQAMTPFAYVQAMERVRAV